MATERLRWPARRSEVAYTENKRGYLTAVGGSPAGMARKRKMGGRAPGDVASTLGVARTRARRKAAPNHRAANGRPLPTGCCGGRVHQQVDEAGDKAGECRKNLPRRPCKQRCVI